MTGGHDAFSLLGVSPEDQLTDDDVRAAWRRIAEATHPDRADGGDPERFAAAAAAYTELRTRYGRNEARAALAEPGRESRRAGRARAGIGARITGGRTAPLALRAASTSLGGTAGFPRGWGGSPRSGAGGRRSDLARADRTPRPRAAVSGA
jgi:curved DNA-binding protein CbpA